MASFEFLAIILTGLGLIVSLVYYANVLSNQNKIQKTQILQKAFESLSTKDTNLDWWKVEYLEWEDYDDFRAKYGPEVDIETWAMINKVWNEMNGIGYLVHQGVMNIESVYDYGGGRPTWMYRKYKPIIEEQRLKNSYRFVWWDYLYEEMRKLSDERGDSFFGIKLEEDNP